MAKLAKSIEVHRIGGKVRLFIDGEEFPFYIARETITTTTDADLIGTVNLTLLADHIEVIDDLGTPVGVHSAGEDCSNHQARQHRDGKEAWCNHCGLTEDGREPLIG